MNIALISHHASAEPLTAWKKTGSLPSSLRAPLSVRASQTYRSWDSLPSITIKKEAAKHFSAVAKNLSSADPYYNAGHLDKFLGDILREDLSPADAALLKNLGDKGNPHVVMLEGAPVGDPTENPLRDSGNISAWFIHALAQLIGANGHSLKTSPNEHGGRLVHDIAPDRNSIALRQTNSSHGKRPLGFHTENPYTIKRPVHGFPGPPDALILLGIRKDPTASTGILPIKSVLRRLSSTQIDELKKPNFVFRSGASFAEVEEVQAPILGTSQDGVHQRFRYLSQTIGKNRLAPTSWGAEQALMKLEEAVAYQITSKSNTSLKLNTGEVAVINNGSFMKGHIGGALHAREGYISNDDRLLKRGLAYRNNDNIAAESF